MQYPLTMLPASRPAHYSLLHDDFGWTADRQVHKSSRRQAHRPAITSRLQAYTNALCYVYARATSAVSIPAPVYCESFRALCPSRPHTRLQTQMCVLPFLPDPLFTSNPLSSTLQLVCGRSEFHYLPDFEQVSDVDSDGRETFDEATFARWKASFKPVRSAMEPKFYFM